VNGEIENEEIVNMSIFTLHYTISKWNQNFLVDHSNYIFINLEHSFCKWFKFVKNNEHVYIKMLKQDHMERIEVYFEPLMKLVNNLQK
jgi:hypothetical protein